MRQRRIGRRRRSRRWRRRLSFLSANRIPRVKPEGMLRRNMRERAGSAAETLQATQTISLLRGVGPALIVGYAAANKSIGAGVIVVFGAARGADRPNAADQTQPHHRPCLLQRCSPFRPSRVSATQGRHGQRRAATCTTGRLGCRPHAAPVPHVQHNRDRDRHRKHNHDNKQQQRDGYSAHGRMIASEGRGRPSQWSRSLGMTARENAPAVHRFVLRRKTPHGPWDDLHLISVVAAFVMCTSEGPALA